VSEPAAPARPPNKLSDQANVGFGGLEPSVAQPPLPLQEFSPLHPLSLDLQPPCPLQSFFPLQECFPLSESVDCASKRTPAFWLALAFTFPLCAGETCACSRAAVPPSSPETAAVKTSDFMVLFMVDPLLGKIDYDHVIDRVFFGYRESLFLF
jgi:hypothetical protein